MTSILVTHQIDDALYIASHRAVAGDRGVRIVPSEPHAVTHADFMMLRDGRLYFQGTAADLQASHDPYIRRYLT